VSGGGRSRLSDDDRILWSRVARSVTPLDGKRQLLGAEPDEAAWPPPEAHALSPEPLVTGGRPAALSARERGARPGFDLPTRTKLAKGRLAIDGRVDLHGMTQGEAHSLLFGFLHRAHADGLRYVLVITGKGSSLGSAGVLRRAVPDWLATPPFRTMVSGHDNAARQHGGGGALYVRLRRRPAGPRG